MRRRIPTDSYIDVIVRERGPAEWEHLTIEVETSFSQEFIDRLKEAVPHGARMWDSTNKVWRILPRYQIFIERVAVEMFDCARRIEGDLITDLKTGASVEQTSLF